MDQKLNNILFLITARGGSKGIPGKNIKELAGKKLIHYSIDIARKFVSDEHICVSTDDEKIINAVQEIGLKVPFVRPSELATDKAGSYEVILHAVNFYLSQNKKYDTLVLLQPTSPFRTEKQVSEALDLYNNEMDMVVSVTQSKLNPYYNLFEEDANGFLKISKPTSIDRRQDCPDVYAYNGAIYVINVKSVLKNPLYKFEKIKKYIMDDISSIDLDTPLDWEWTEFLINKKIVKI